VNRMDTMTVRWVLIWAAMAGVILGADYAIRAAVRERRRRRADRAWAAGVAQGVRDAEYLRWLDDHWADDAGVDIFDSEGDPT
jgi:hypothetical protein